MFMLSFSLIRWYWHFQEIFSDLGSSTGPIAIGPMLSLKKRNKSSFAIEKVRVTGVGGHDIAVVAEAVAGKVSTLAVVIDHRRLVSVDIIFAQRVY